MGDGGRLNFFQRMMLRWRDLHPYNPVHVVHVPAKLEPERLRACIAARLEALGLTGLALDRPRWRLRFEGGPAVVELAVIAAAGDAPSALSMAIEREFNRPFTPGRHENPFRFIAIDDGGAYQLMLVYDHYVASGDSIAGLLTGIACAMLAPADMPLPMPTPLQRHAATYRAVLWRHPLWVLRSVLGLPRMIAGARRAYRPRYTDVQDASNAYLSLCLQPVHKRALLHTAKEFGVSLNALLTACLMLALSPLAARRHDELRRTQLAVASILNMRQDFQPEVQNALSPFLAAYRVAHAVPQGIGLRALARDVHAQASHIKRRHLYLQSLLGLGVSALLWPRLTLAQQQGFYPKHFAVSAGITSLNIDPIWARAGLAAAARLDYQRAVPTGPLCPMVLAVTGAHERLNVGIAFRTTVYPRAAVQRLAAQLLSGIEQLPQVPSS